MAVAQPSPQVAALLPEARATINRVARSFALAARLLPPQVRGDVDLLYLALRSLDDLVDVQARSSDAERAAATRRIAAIEVWAQAPNAVPINHELNVPEPFDSDGGRELLIFDDLGRRYPLLPRDAVADFLAGMRADLLGPRIATEVDHERYCYQVAGTVGRLMAAILGVSGGAEGDADRAARALGVAMQRTNILRDIDEDLAAGRIYISDEALRAAGLDPAAASGSTSLRDGDRRALLRDQIARADAAYEAGGGGIRHLRHGRRSIATAAALYREILRQIERDGLGRRRPHRPVVGRARKGRILIGALLRDGA